MVSTSQMYEDAVSATISCTNAVYDEFLRSEEGYGFRGEVLGMPCFVFTWGGGGGVGGWG